MMVVSTVSTTRRPPVMAQRKGSMAAVVAQLRKLPLQAPLQVRLVAAPMGVK